MSSPPANVLKDIGSGDAKNKLHHVDPVVKNPLPADINTSKILSTEESKKKEISSFDKSALRGTATKEKVAMPSHEDVKREKNENELKGMIGTFNKCNLQHVKTVEKNVLDKDINTTKIVSGKDDIKQGICKFDKNAMKHAETAEKVVMPSKDDLDREKEERKHQEGISNFKRTSLQHVEPDVKNPLPDKTDIDTQRIVTGKANFNEGISGFNKGQLKHAETKEKASLPSPTDVKQEKCELEHKAEITKFKRNSLQKVQTDEKNTLPDKAAIEQEKQFA